MQYHTLTYLLSVYNMTRHYGATHSADREPAALEPAASSVPSSSTLQPVVREKYLRIKQARVYWPMKVVGGEVVSGGWRGRSTCIKVKVELAK